MLYPISKHAKCLKEITKEHREIPEKLMTITGGLIFRCLLNKIIWKSKRNRMDSLLQKNKKLGRLITYSPSINTRLQHPHNQFEPKGTKPTQNGTRLKFCR